MNHPRLVPRQTGRVRNTLTGETYPTATAAAKAAGVARQYMCKHLRRDYLNPNVKGVVYDRLLPRRKYKPRKPQQ